MQVIVPSANAILAVMTEETEKNTALLVDDEMMMRQMLKVSIKEAGLTIIGEASNGEDAILLCSKHKPQLVCLDLNMPKMDGLETLKILKPEFPNTVFVIITADASTAKVKEAIDHGASGFILKPFNVGQVTERLNKILAANLVKDKSPAP